MLFRYVWCVNDDGEGLPLVGTLSFLTPEEAFADMRESVGDALSYEQVAENAHAFYDSNNGTTVIGVIGRVSFHV